jgi:hypothetical protein
LGPCLRQVYSPLFEVFHMYEHSLKLFLVDRLCALFAIAYKFNKISKNDEILNMFHSLLKTNILKYGNSCNGGDDFSHAYVFVHHTLVQNKHFKKCLNKHL